MPDPLSSTASAAPSHDHWPAPLNYDEVRRLMAPLPTHSFTQMHLLPDLMRCAAASQGGSAIKHHAQEIMRGQLGHEDADLDLVRALRILDAQGGAGGGPQRRRAAGVRALAKDALRLCARMGLLDEDRRCTEAGLQMAQSDANDALRTAAQWLHDSWMTPGEPPWPMLQILHDALEFNANLALMGAYEFQHHPGLDESEILTLLIQGMRAEDGRIVATDALHRIGAHRRDAWRSAMREDGIEADSAGLPHILAPRLAALHQARERPIVRRPIDADAWLACCEATLDLLILTEHLQPAPEQGYALGERGFIWTPRQASWMEEMEEMEDEAECGL